MCSKECDPFGHHAHLCDTTNKTIDHNYARDIIKSVGGAIGFVTDKEVVVCPWEKKPDVELKDPSAHSFLLVWGVSVMKGNNFCVYAGSEIRTRQGI